MRQPNEKTFPKLADAIEPSLEWPTIGKEIPDSDNPSPFCRSIETAMNEQQKTFMYVAIAILMAVAGTMLAPRGPQATQDGIESLVGTEFYKDFKNPSEATSIEVITYDPVTATASPFSVEFKDGLWRIPTRFNYPADAKDRLAKVATSIIGLKRDALAGKTVEEQAEFQVLDPKAEKAENLKGIGNRLTLKNGSNVLADYIIGKQVPGRPSYYYVRKPDEKQTFMAKLEISLSTKFTDWIESDVLNLDGFKLTSIDIMKHSLEVKGNRAKLVGQEDNHLTRPNSSDPWTLEGLDNTKEEVDQDAARKLVTGLDDLKIVGVRPKPESLRKGLEANEGISLDAETEDDLAQRGFFFMPTKKGGLQMISMEGDLIAGTDQGVEYEMHFGNVFEGTEEEIEKGFLDNSGGETASDSEKKSDGEDKPDEEKPEEKASEKKKSRFIFVTARVNPDLLGPVPEEPTKPEPPAEKPAETPTEEKPVDTPAAEEKPAEEKPAEEKPAEELKPEEGSSAPTEESTTTSENSEKTAGDPTASDEKPTVEENSTEESSTEEKPTAEKPAEEKPAETTSEKPAEPENTPPQPPQPDPKKVYEEALQKYEIEVLKYEQDLKSREEKLKAAEETIRTLNARFAEWYYVISAESFENLRQGRSTLVKAKEGTAESSSDQSPPADGAPLDNTASEKTDE